MRQVTAKNRKSKRVYWTMYWTVLGSLLISLAVAPLMWGQAALRLEVEVSPSQQVRILAREVSYGEVLRALQQKLGMAIEIPPLADELKLSYARIEAARPEEALEKLLEASGLGYAFLRRANGTQLEKVLVVASSSQKANERAVRVPASNPPIASPAEGPTAQPFLLDGKKGSEEDQNPQVPQMQVRPLSEAGIVIGTNSGTVVEEAAGVHIDPLPPEAQPVVRPLSDAVRVIGVPPGVSAEDVGKTKILPLPPSGQKRP